MKKFFTTIAIFIICLTSTALAATQNSYKDQTIAVVIVGTPDYKTDNYVRYAKEYFEEANVNKNLTILSGNDVQSKYQTYWLEKGLLDEGTPTKQDFIDFVSYGNYDKAIYLVVKDPVIDVHNRKSKQRTRASVTVNAFLVDENQIIKVASSTNENDSKTSELRAKRGAFKQCVRDISEVINPLLK